MSGKRYKTVSIVEEEYRRLHEAEMRERFMQTTNLGTETHVVFVEERLPARTEREWEMGLVRTRLVPRTVSVAAMSSLAMPSAAVQAMRPAMIPAPAQAASPFDMYLAEISAEMDRLEAEYPLNLLTAGAVAMEQVERERGRRIEEDDEVNQLAEAPARALSVPALPPAWYRQSAGKFVAQLESIGYFISGYDPDNHIITLNRADDRSKVTILLTHHITAAIVKEEPSTKILATASLQMASVNNR